MSISKKAWTFPERPYYYKLSFPKINIKPNNSKTEGERDIPGPGQPRGKGLPCRFLSHPMTLSPGQPRGEGLPCRFLSHPVTLSPGLPRGEEQPCRFLSHPGDSQHYSIRKHIPIKIVRCYVYKWRRKW